MSLTLGDSKVGGGSKQIQKGVIVDTYKVHKITNQSGEEFFGKTFDLAIQIEIDIGKEFYPKMWLRGNLKSDNGEIVGWGGAFPIDLLFSNLGVYDILPDDKKTALIQKLEIGEIPSSLLAFCEGKEFQGLKYVDKLYEGKPSYKYYKFTQKPEDDPKVLVDRFNKDVSNGYVVNFHPELLDTTDTSFSYGANVDNDAKDATISDDGSLIF